MIFLQAPPYTTFVVDFVPGEPVYQMVQRVKDSYRLEFRGNYTLRDTSQGTVLNGSEIAVDDRIYHLTAWIVGR